MVTDAVQETNELRKSLSPAMVRDRSALQALANKLRSTRALAREPIVQCFIEDVTASGDSIRLHHTKAHINEQRDHTIFSLFDASYFPSLSLDMLTYRPVNVVSDSFASRFESKTNPVTIDAMSNGFEDRVVVALFPENHIDGIQDPNDAIFYFVDKFVERHIRITRQLLTHVVAPASFPLLEGLSHDELLLISSHWVWLHEYFHRQGDMPIPERLDLKVSHRALAGLEELRADMLGLTALRGDCGLSEHHAAMTYQFILAERLLRYSVEGIPTPNYDAIASQLLFGYLRENGGVRVEGGCIKLTPRTHDVLARFLGEIQAIEARIHTESEDAVGKRLLAFVNSYTNYDAEIDVYHHVEFFVDVKRRLRV